MELKREILISKAFIMKVETEKPKTEEIEEKEERIEEIKPSSAIFEEIEAKKPRFEEIFQKAYHRVGSLPASQKPPRPRHLDAVSSQGRVWGEGPGTHHP